MGTALTGLEIKDTYDGLVKTTDNGPISGTAKYLSDGLGNDSALALSTTQVGVGASIPAITTAKLTVGGQLTNTANLALQLYKTGTPQILNGDVLGNIWFVGIDNDITTGTNNIGARVSAVATTNWTTDGTTSNTALTFHTHGTASGDAPERMRIDSTGNVGIGTITPAVKLDVTGDIRTTVGLRLGANADGTTGQFLTDGTDTYLDYKGNLIYRASASSGERARLTENGFLRFASGTGGVQFNGDTAAANALDDYEEGTWTPTITFGGAAVDLTYAANEGAYTKIGRQVTLSGICNLSNKGSSSGSALITGLPFTVGGTNGLYSSVTLRIGNVTFTNQFQGFANINTTNILLQEITILGAVTALTDADFANNSEVMISLTYFV